ncbi:MAG: PQQ-dependent sugar dehydrogenase [Chloroflexi bacterium]|nr:MAG: PQQ-dependent sugar dehydrogenase [Chloroflexota bacterium]
MSMWTYSRWDPNLVPSSRSPQFFREAHLFSKLGFARHSRLRLSTRLPWHRRVLPVTGAGRRANRGSHRGMATMGRRDPTSAIYQRPTCSNNRDRNRFKGRRIRGTVARRFVRGDEPRVPASGLCGRLPRPRGLRQRDVLVDNDSASTDTPRIRPRFRSNWQAGGRGNPDVFPVRASVRGTLSRQAVISTAATVAALAVVIVAWSSGLQVMNATSGSGESILATERIASGADAVAAMAVAPDGRIFLAEQRTGRVRVIVAGLLVPDAVITFVLRASGPEDGLTGLAAAPDFASNNLLYAAYTYEDRNKSDQPLNRIVRFHVTPENRSSDLEVIRDDLPGGDFHNCNTLRFGPDGKLWFCNGDTGWTNDVSQSVASPEGKIHRINADGSIPVDNPFPHSSVYALGFRNPFGLGFEPNTGRLFVADNGPECCDEVDLVMPGGNYGWPYWKGDEVAEAGAPNERFIGPLWTRRGCCSSAPM